MGKRVAILGATGAVGGEFLRLLEERSFATESIKLLASARSAGRTLRVRSRQVTVEEVTEASFDDVDLVLSSAGSSVSKRFVPAAVEAGAVVVDNTSAFRMDPEVPLVIPEINPQDIPAHKGIIANPNCSTIIMNMAVWPIHKVNPVRRIVVSTYQAASGAGARAMAELEESTRAALDDREYTPEALPHPSAFNVFCHDSEIGADGYNLEERKMVRETHKIFHDDGVRITATCVRVPVLRAHSEAINLECSEPIDEDEVRSLLAETPGIRIVDDRQANYFPMPLDASGKDEILVGRIRRDISQPDGRGIEMFVSGDQIRKGAALNAVQIAELL